MPVAAKVQPVGLAGTVALKLAVLLGPMVFDAVPLTLAVRVEFSCMVTPVNTPVAGLNEPRFGVVPLRLVLALEVAVAVRSVSVCDLVRLKLVDEVV